MQRGDDGRNQAGGKPPSRISPELVGWILVAVAAAIFIVQNGNRTTVEFLFIERTMRLWVVIVIAIVLGALLGWLLPRVIRRRRRTD